MGTAPFQIRTFHRLPVQCPVYFHHGQVQGTGSLWNLSLDGCRIDGNVPLRRGTVVELLMLLPGSHGAVLVKEAAVCWTRGRECGLRLVTVQPREAAHLECYVAGQISESAYAQYSPR